MIKVVNNKVMFEDWVYSFLKKFVQIFLPAFSTFYFALAKTWGLPDATAVIGSVASLCTFIGILLHLSSSQYDASGATYDGTISHTINKTGSALALHIDPAVVLNKDSVKLQVIDATSKPAVPQSPAVATQQTPLPPSQS